MIPLYLPSPSHGVWYLGPIPIRGYALSILVGIIVAFILAVHRWKKWGESPEQMENIALLSVIIGIVGARAYWVVIEWDRYFGQGHTEPWYHIFYVWEGGLGIWGGITFGFITAWLLCRHYKIHFLRMADAVAPAFLLAQGIGRLGNWWNQELYGYPSTLPWALEIDPIHRVPGYAQFSTFHPTFLYEMLWDFLGVAVLLLLEKKLKLGRGKLFATYIIIYAVGRFLVELLRIDPVHVYFGLRVNSWATLLGGVAGVVLLALLVKFRPGPNLPKTVTGAADEETAQAVTDEKAGDSQSEPDASAASAEADSEQPADKDPVDVTDMTDAAAKAEG